MAIKNNVDGNVFLRNADACRYYHIDPSTVSRNLNFGIQGYKYDFNVITEEEYFREKFGKEWDIK